LKLKNAGDQHRVGKRCLILLDTSIDRAGIVTVVVAGAEGDLLERLHLLRIAAEPASGRTDRRELDMRKVFLGCEVSAG
jgi:hypothetical protein